MTLHTERNYSDQQLLERAETAADMVSDFSLEDGQSARDWVVFARAVASLLQASANANDR
jgi:hypothetical protein